MLSLPKHGKNGKSIWLKFVQSGLVEDCPFCNPEIEYLYRLNPEKDPVVETNFHMTLEIPRTKKRRNYLAAKAKYKTCSSKPLYDHHHHKYNSFKSNSKNTSLYGSMTSEIGKSFVDKFGRSINEKIKFKTNPTKDRILDSRLYQKRKFQRRTGKKSTSYAKLYKKRVKK